MTKVKKEKKCTKCGCVLPLIAQYWYRSKRAKDGFESQCKSCKQTEQKIYYEKNKKRICRRTREWAIKNHEKFRAYQKKWLENNKEQAREVNRKGVLRRRYGITIEQYDQILREQNYCCAICGKHVSKFKKRLYIDHNHKTGFIRGLVCNYCNAERIGKLRDNKVIWVGMKNYIGNALENDKAWKV